MAGELKYVNENPPLKYVQAFTSTIFGSYKARHWFSKVMAKLC